MDAADPRVPTSTAGNPPGTVVLLCRDLERRVAGLCLDELAGWLSERLVNTVAQCQDDLCHDLPAAADATLHLSGQRSVLALCSPNYREADLQAYARKAHLDPLGLQALDLAAACEGGKAPLDRGKLILAGAVARAQAFRGSQPENLKAVLDIDGRHVSRRALFRLPPLTYLSVTAIVPHQCSAGAGCDLCVRACPSGALEVIEKGIRVDRSRCEGCGFCVAACPQRAVELPGSSPGEIEAHATGLLVAEAGPSGRALAFVCKSRHGPVDGAWLRVPVPCAGMVPAAAIFQLLARGAAAVALSPCGEACPAGGRDRALSTAAYCRQVLTLLGGVADRVRVLGSTNDDDSLLPALQSRRKGSDGAGPPRFFGAGAAAAALEALAAAYSHEGPLSLEHRDSPFGTVQLDPDACTGCASCVAGCPTGALTREGEPGKIAITFDPRLCAGCGKCASLCPEQEAGALKVSPVLDLALLAQGRTPLYQDQEVSCRRCGGPVASRGVLRRIAALLQEEYSPRLMEHYCGDCRGLVFQ